MQWSTLDFHALATENTLTNSSTNGESEQTIKHAPMPSHAHKYVNAVTSWRKDIDSQNERVCGNIQSYLRVIYLLLLRLYRWDFFFQTFFQRVLGPMPLSCSPFFVPSKSCWNTKQYVPLFTVSMHAVGKKIEHCNLHSVWTTCTCKLALEQLALVECKCNLHSTSATCTWVQVQLASATCTQHCNLHTQTCKFESSQKDESRWQSTDSSKACRKTSAFKYHSKV